MPVRRVKIAFGISCDMAAIGAPVGAGVEAAVGAGPAARAGNGASKTDAQSANRRDSLGIRYLPGRFSYVAINMRGRRGLDLDQAHPPSYLPHRVTSDPRPRQRLCVKQDKQSKRTTPGGSGEIQNFNIMLAAQRCEQTRDGGD